MKLDYEQVRRLLALKPNHTYAQLAQLEFGDANKASELRKSLLDARNNIVIPEPAEKLVASVLTIPYADALIIGDIHTPYQNSELLNTAIELARAAKIKQVDIAGDLHDFNAISPMNKGEPSTDVDTDISHARQILHVLAYHFESIRVVSGNHDEYWLKKHRGSTFQDLIYNEVLQGQLSNQVTATDYDYFLRGDDWVVGHLSSYHEDPGYLASRIADLFDRNVAVGHDHLRGHRYGEKGHIGISIGAMLTPDRFWYKSRRLNVFPPFMLGFLLLINNHPFHFSDIGNTPLNGNRRNFDYWKKYFKEGKHL